MKNKIKVLIVDDSAVVRHTLTEILNSDPHIEVIATASDPYFAATKIQNEVPDVITLDVEMPKMDGLTFLKKIMSQHPIPVVIISSLTAKGTETAIKALEYGAVEVITKPKLESDESWEDSKVRIVDIIKAASLSKPRRKAQAEKVAPKLSADAMISSSGPTSMIKTTEKVIAVGASTGVAGLSGAISSSGSSGSAQFTSSASAQLSPPAFKYGESSSLGTRIPVAFSTNTKVSEGFSGEHYCP
ncbi:MAG: response regulator [Proteobacteria bacterium]|nr:MAG: response regulator [Pseudomonadota bacterium]